MEKIEDTTAEKCQAACRANEDCERWLFIGNEDVCWLKNGEYGDCEYDDKRETDSDKGYVTGLKGTQCVIPE